MSRVRWPALYSNYNLAHEWKERVQLLIHQILKAEDSTGVTLEAGGAAWSSQVERRKLDDTFV